MIFIIPEWIIWGMAYLVSISFLTRYILDRIANRNQLFRFLLWGKIFAFFLAGLIYMAFDLDMFPGPTPLRAEVVRFVFFMILGGELTYNGAKILTDENIKKLFRRLRHE